MRTPRIEIRRLERERRTVRIMIELYCQNVHKSEPQANDTGMPIRSVGTTGLCPDCAALYAYAVKRIERCRFGAKKPVCAKCPVHCFASPMRAQIKKIMRYSGSRMLLSHPWLAVQHMIDRAKSVPSTHRPSV